jgi:hypothetical protein
MRAAVNIAPPLELVAVLRVLQLCGQRILHVRQRRLQVAVAKMLLQRENSLKLIRGSHVAELANRRNGTRTDDEKRPERG